MPSRISWLVLFAFASLPACGPGLHGGDGGTQTQEQDLAQYDMLQTQLDSARNQFLGNTVQELHAEGNQLYWLDFTNADPTLHRYDDTTGARVDYGFSIGTGDMYNYRARGGIVVTAVNDGSMVTYTAYDSNQANHVLGTTQFPAPGSGVRWYAYAVDGGNVYIMQTGTMNTLLRWTPGPGATPSMVTTLESAGVMVGEFQDFDVSGNTMIFIESGRIWQMDLSTNTAHWLHNQTEVGGDVEFESDGAMFTDSMGLMFFRYSDGMLINVSAEIMASPYQLNATYSTAHYWYQDFTRWNQWVIYIGNDGVFAFDMTAQTIRPILLSPRAGDTRIDYRYPVVLDDGQLFVTGLTSTSGAVGADGPVYRVSVSSILH